MTSRNTGNLPYHRFGLYIQNCVVILVQYSVLSLLLLPTGINHDWCRGIMKFRHSKVLPKTQLLLLYINIFYITIQLGKHAYNFVKCLETYIAKFLFKSLYNYYIYVWIMDNIFRMTTILLKLAGSGSENIRCFLSVRGLYNFQQRVRRKCTLRNYSVSKKKVSCTL